MEQQQVSKVILVLVVLLAGYNCSFSQLDNHNFTQAVVSSDKIWVVAFYSPRCTPCLQFVQEWQKLVEGKFAGLEFGLVNIDDKEGFALAADMGIFEEGMPNVKVFPYEFDRTGVAVWNGVEQPSVDDIQFKLQGILGEHLENGHYRKLPHLLI